MAVDDPNVDWTTGADGLIQARAKQGDGPVITVSRDSEQTLTLAVDDVNVCWGVTPR